MLDIMSSKTVQQSKEEFDLLTLLSLIAQTLGKEEAVCADCTVRFIKGDTRLCS